MADKTRIVAQDTFVPVGEGWFNYYADTDNPGKFYKESCPGFIYHKGEWRAATVDGGYLEVAGGVIRTGRGLSWISVEESEANPTEWTS